MGNRGQQSFKKRQKEQQRKEKQQEKFAKRLDKKPGELTGDGVDYGSPEDRFAEFLDDDEIAAGVTPASLTAAAAAAAPAPAIAPRAPSTNAEPQANS